MKYEPIKIIIKDKRLFCATALFFDNYAVLEDIYKLRKKWSVDKFNQRLKFADDFYEEWLDIILNEKHKAKEKVKIDLNSLIPDKARSYNKLPSSYDKYRSKGDRYDEDEQILSFLYDTKKIRLKYKKAPFFDPAIVSAVIVNTISDQDIDSAFAKFVHPHSPQAPFAFGNMAIFFYPDTTKTEIIKVFESSKKQLIKEYSNYYHLDTYYHKNTIENIKLHRYWYWEKQKSKTYKQISKDDKSRSGIDITVYSETIRKAIKQYEKRLAQSIKAED